MLIIINKHWHRSAKIIIIITCLFAQLKRLTINWQGIVYQWSFVRGMSAKYVIRLTSINVKMVKCVPVIIYSFHLCISRPPNSRIKTCENRTQKPTVELGAVKCCKNHRQYIDDSLQVAASSNLEHFRAANSISARLNIYVL